MTESDKAETALSVPRSVSGINPRAHMRKTGTMGPANIITSALLSFFFTTVMLPPLVAVLVHLKVPDFDTILVSNPVSEPGYELAAVVLSPQVHASAAPLGGSGIISGVAGIVAWPPPHDVGDREQVNREETPQWCTETGS